MIWIFRGEPLLFFGSHEKPIYCRKIMSMVYKCTFESCDKLPLKILRNIKYKPQPLLPNFFKLLIFKHLPIIIYTKF